jgi:UrcA family protein
MREKAGKDKARPGTGVASAFPRIHVPPRFRRVFYKRLKQSIDIALSSPIRAMNMLISGESCMKSFLVAAAVALLTAAPAVAADPVRIALADLDLGTARGAALLDARIDAAAAALCRDARRPGSRLSDRAWCEAGVRAEVMDRLPNRARADYVRATDLLTVRVPTVSR